jgi:hypothetical protein
MCYRVAEHTLGGQVSLLNMLVVVAKLPGHLGWHRPSGVYYVRTY